MAVQALKDYSFAPADTQDKFHGNQLLYVGWDDHLMFCAPLAFCIPPGTRFGDFCATALAQGFGAHPDWAKVDLSQAVWLKSGQPFTPDMKQSLAEQGLKHKDILRLQTPGLTGIAGSCS